MLVELSHCDSYSHEIYVNPVHVTSVFIVTGNNGKFEGKVNDTPYTVVALCDGQQIKIAMNVTEVIAKLSGIVQ